ncbi:MAG: host specificity protein, partial [Lentisphaeria bacterium]|nr:host specificity protein [Lentisphaeria bacterium]
MIDNNLDRFRSKVGRGEVCLGAVITLSYLTVSEIAGDLGFDFLWIDAEHAPHTVDGVMKHIIAARGTGAAPFVRVRCNDPWLIKPVVDLAPAGVIVPMVNTAEEAEAAVAACRYPL